MKMTTRYNNNNTIMCETNMIELTDNEQAEFQSFCNAVFGTIVHELHGNRKKCFHYVNGVQASSYGFKVVCSYIKKKFGIADMYEIRFNDKAPNFLWVMNLYQDADEDTWAVKDGKNHY